MKVSTIINDVAKELGDPSFVTWTRPTLISLLNQAVKQVILVRPDAYSETVVVKLAKGTKQSLPKGSLRLLDVVRNMGYTGLQGMDLVANPPVYVAGRAIRLTTSGLLNAFDPDWHSSTEKDVVSSYVYDESVPDVFYTNPPTKGETYVEIQVSKVPDELNINMPDEDTAGWDAVTHAPTIEGVDEPGFNGDAAVALSDIYSNAIIEWILYKTFSFEASSASSVATANTHMNSFYNSLGVKTKSDAANSPNAPNQ